MKKVFFKISMQCNTRGVRMMKSDGYMELFNYHFQEHDLTGKIYEAWWNWLDEIGVDTKQMHQMDYTPVYFHLNNVDKINLPGSFGASEVADGIYMQTHRGRKGEWYEKLYTGSFQLEITFEKISGLDKVIRAFVNNLKMGFITLGGGKSIGHGVVETQGVNVPEVKNEEYRCPKGHFTSMQNFCFGGKCKCGSKVVPQWTKVPEGYDMFC